MRLNGIVPKMVIFAVTVNHQVTELEWVLTRAPAFRTGYTRLVYLEMNSIDHNPVGAGIQHVRNRNRDMIWTSCTSPKHSTWMKAR